MSTTTATVWRLCLAGAGNVGAGLLAMLQERAADLRDRYGVEFRVTALAELGGAAFDPDGLDLPQVLKVLASGGCLGDVPEVGRPGMTSARALELSGADILLEATPVNLRDGQPALDTVRSALTAGRHVVLANKAPLALAYRELVDLSDPSDGWAPTRPAVPGRTVRPRLRFSATVAGALPVVNLGHRDLAGCRITRLEAVLNGTSHSILRAMEAGGSFADALADAQRRGIAEADPTLDVDGHDSACKLVIAANAVLGQPANLDDVLVEGIRDISADTVSAASAQGRHLVLLCLAEWTGDGYRLSVRPTALPADHPLAVLTPDEMGVAYHADRVDRFCAATLEPGAVSASAAMLRDVLDIVRLESIAGRCRPRRTLRHLPGRYAMCRFAADQPVPSWALAGACTFTSVTRTADELSIICPVEALPDPAQADTGWRCLRIEGPFGLDEPGVLASVVTPIADAGLSVFAVATYDTDYLLVTAPDAATQALRAAGHQVIGEPERH